MKPLADLSPPHAETVIPACHVRRGTTTAAPLVFASPHSGTLYPAKLRAQLKVPLLDLRRTEDAFIDELFADAVAKNTCLIAANYARCYVDLNRDAHDLDPSMFADGVPRACGLPSVRVKAGLGCLPRIGASGRQIYAGKLQREEGARRLDLVHDGYHTALNTELDRLKQDWADVYLIDCHSMPSVQPGRSGLPDIVLGDRFGSSCTGRLTSLAERVLRAEGLSVVRNAPYAGGYTTRRYGRPRRGVHVLQIEINRGLYLDEHKVEKLAGFDAFRQVTARLQDALIDFARAENGLL